MQLLDILLGAFKWFTVFEIILCVINLVVLVWYAIPVRKYYRWLDFLPGAGLVVAIAGVLYGDTSLPALAIYALTTVIFLCTVKKTFRPVRQIPVPKYRWLRIVLCLCGVIPIVLALLTAGALRYNPVSHFRDLSYSQAFIQLNERLSREYPFGEWKQVDWQALERKYTPVFELAEQEQNKELYYKTLREYLFSFRDGHIKIVNEDLYTGNTVFKQENGGGFGISTIMLDNGKVLVNLVLKDSPAEQTGIGLGDEIVTWDGKPAQQVYSDTKWSENPLATDGDARFNQGRFMTRAQTGTKVQIQYRKYNSSDNGTLQKVTLTAYDDNYETLKRTRIKLKRTDAPVEGRILDNGYGYIKIRYFLASDAIDNPASVMQELLKEFKDKAVKGLIVDVRDNPGGEDDLAATMAGLLMNEKRHYEDISYYSRMTGKFEINAAESLVSKPAQSGYKGNTAILINHTTGSSGEGIPLRLRGLPHIRIVGFTSTNGSFGVVSSPIQAEMPEGYLLQFPDGRSLDENHMIQGDSNHAGQGGAAPDIQLPLNELTFTEKYIQGEDVELKAAIEALEGMN